MTGWILSFGEEIGGSDGASIVTDDATTSERRKTVRRFAVAQGIRLRASSTSAGPPGPPVGPLLLSRLPWAITATSGHEPWS